MAVTTDVQYTDAASLKKDIMCPVWVRANQWERTLEMVPHHHHWACEAADLPESHNQTPRIVLLLCLSTVRCDELFVML